jgi:hypothetical protein
MADMTHQELEAAVNKCFGEVADQVFDDKLVGQLEAAATPSAFRVTEKKLKDASTRASLIVPMHIKSSAFSGFGKGWGTIEGTGGSAKIDLDRIVEEADDEKRKKAADGIRSLLCGKLRDWIEKNLEQLKTWLEELGIKETLKKMWEIGKQLTIAAVTAIAGVVGSMFLAYLFIAVAVAAVGAALYYVAKKGLPNYCPA